VGWAAWDIAAEVARAKLSRQDGLAAPDAPVRAAMIASLRNWPAHFSRWASLVRLRDPPRPFEQCSHARFERIDPKKAPMKIHEFQAKTLLKRFGVRVPEGRECTTVAQAEAACAELGGGVIVVKAQIHAGGRGKGGGVKVCKSAEEVREAAQKILGMQLVTHQTGPAGQLVQRIWVEKGSAIDKEFYIGIAIDRESQLPVMMASSEGGMEIEHVAETQPEKILKASFEPRVGLKESDAQRLAAGIGIPAALSAKATSFMQALAKAFVELDCSIAEINPLVTTKEGEVLALDAKINFDENALFRHEELLALRDLSEEQPLEIEASKFGLNYIKLDGTIGCMVNGAGLAMSTMDVIQLYGGEPANFLDVGGGATKEQVTAAFKILLADPKTKVVLINIFGGIMKCDVLATGVVAAAREVQLELPLVVRLEGTNVELGRKVLADSGLPIIAAKDLDDAAQKAVAAAKQPHAAKA
jgi:succinyl-CoA synthetase beta subunit